MSNITIKRVTSSHLKIQKYIQKTPIILSYELSYLTDKCIYLKCENLQVNKSFKIRGALNKILELPGLNPKEITLIAVSTGNHAQGVALAGKLLGYKTLIYMPHKTPHCKVEATKKLGAKVEFYGSSFWEANNYAQTLSLNECNLIYIPAFDDEDIIIGQGTIMLEIFEQIKRVDQIIVPIGGGGLISGIAVVAKLIKPTIIVTGVQASQMPSATRALENNSPIKIEQKETLADGIALQEVGHQTFEYIQKYVDEIILVDEDEIKDSIKFLYKKNGQIVEGAGAVSVAYLLRRPNNLKEKVVAILSGGNINLDTFQKIVEE